MLRSLTLSCSLLALLAGCNSPHSEDNMPGRQNLFVGDTFRAAQMNKAMQVAQEFRARHDYRVTLPSDGQTGEENGTVTQGPTLEELEVTADTYKKMYESFLQSFTSSVSQQS